MVFQKWSPVGSQSTDLSSLIVKGVTLSESVKAYFIDTLIDGLSFSSNDMSNPLSGFLRTLMITGA